MAPAKSMGALRTLSLFAAASREWLAQVVFSGFAVLVVWPLLLGWAGTRLAAPHLYTPPKCASYGWQKSVAASPLWEAELVLVETAMWFALGLLSTIGWGTGLRTALVALALVVAIAVPCFSDVASFIGALFSMAVSATFPSVCYLKIARNHVTKREVCINVAVILLSVACAAAGTYSALRGIVACLS